MLGLLAILNLTVMASVFGYAVSASAVAHPAMMACSREVAVGFFKPFFHKSAHLQMALSLVVLAIALLQGLLGAGWFWFAGAVVLQLSGPYTFVRYWEAEFREIQIRRKNCFGGMVR
ncbi:MAG: hypothetical protein ABJO27_27945 [Pseudoruegeria sp.]